MPRAFIIWHAWIHITTTKPVLNTLKHVATIIFKAQTATKTSLTEDVLLRAIELLGNNQYLCRLHVCPLASAKQRYCEPKEKHLLIYNNLRTCINRELKHRLSTRKSKTMRRWSSSPWLFVKPWNYLPQKFNESYKTSERWSFANE